MGKTDDRYLEREKKAAELAGDVILLSRSTLLVNFRFLSRALSRLEPVYDPNVSLACDGVSLYYGAWYVLSLYRESRSLVPRALLHSLLHCVLRHSFVGEDIDRLRWDLACDMAVENAITELENTSVRTPRHAQQQSALGIVRDAVGTLTAERIYKWLGDTGFTPEELEAQRECFIADGHGIWYGEGDPDAKEDDRVNLKKMWEEVSRRMQTELETVNKDKDGALVQNLRRLNRSRVSYTDFLRRFGLHGETMQISDEEFDNNYYTYGLSLYGNMPLIEPLEYSQQKRIREFVIAIDTSGSVKGEVVQSFIQHTHDILMQTESFFTKIDLHIIQCDDRVREDVTVKSREEFEKYLSSMEILGLGRTDFRPVFDRVNSLIREGKLKNLQGLIYFTDGDGIFPQTKPAYDTAFILHTDDYSEPELPPWAMHLTLSEDDILDKRFSAY